MTDTPPASRLIVLVGLPGSGKTTWARGWVHAAQREGETRARVCRDDARMTMHGVLYEPDAGREDRVTVAVEAMAEALLRAGVSVVADATHLRRRWRNRWRDIAFRTGARVEVVDLTHVPLEECIRRDAGREPALRVGADVIRRMWETRDPVEDGEGLSPVDAYRAIARDLMAGADRIAGLCATGAVAVSYGVDDYPWDQIRTSVNSLRGAATRAALAADDIDLSNETTEVRRTPPPARTEQEKGHE